MKKALIITLSLLLVAVVGTAFYTLNQRTANDTPRRINLDEGTSYQALCDTLDASPTFRLMAHALGLDKHVRDARMAGERSHLAAARRDGARCVDGAERLQQAARLPEAERRRRSQPRQRLGFTSAPGGDGEQHLRQVRFQYLRPAVFLHTGFSAGTP